MRWVAVIAGLVLAGFPAGQDAHADAQEDYYLCATIVEDHVEAIQRCTAAIDSGAFHGDDLAWAYNNRSYELRHVGKLSPAIRDAEAAINLNPEVPAFWANLADAQRDINQPDAAIQSYTEALHLAETHGEGEFTVGQANMIEAICLNLGILYHQAGDRNAAWSYLERAYPVFSGHPSLQSIFEQYSFGEKS